MSNHEIDRVLVVGPIGCGKSWAAKRIAELIRRPLVHLDTIMMDSESGEPKPKERFIEDAESFFQAQQLSDGWVADGTFRSIRHITWERADVIGYIRPSLVLNSLLLAKRAFTHDTSAGNSDQDFVTQYRRLISTRRDDIAKIDNTTAEFDELGTQIVRSKTPQALVKGIGQLVSNSY